MSHQPWTIIASAKPLEQGTTRCAQSPASSGRGRCPFRLAACACAEDAAPPLRRLFDQTVRADYERALAKQRLGPLPQPATHTPDGDWRELPLIKSRLAGGYCLRTAAQGVWAYTNVCDHCPNFRSQPGMPAVLSAQRADARQLAQDAQRRGWNDEADCHLALVERVDAIIAKTDAA